MEIALSSVSAGWAEVVALFATEAAIRIPTRHGVSFDIAGLTIWVEDCGPQNIPDGYLYPELVRDYRERLFGSERDSSLFYQRLEHGTDFGDSHFSQTDQMYSTLALDPNSRAAVFSTWHPAKDYGIEFPVSPVGGSFRIIDERLVLFVTARSVDAWVGLVPELLTLARYADDMAQRLGLRESVLCYHSWSAHIYETDLLVYLTDGSI